MDTVIEAAVMVLFCSVAVIAVAAAIAIVRIVWEQF